MSHKVVLPYTPSEGGPLRAPPCILVLASKPREKNFEPVSIDAAVEPEYKKSVCEALDSLIAGSDLPTEAVNAC